MLNNDWEKNLKDLLGDYKPEGLQPDWDEFSNQMDQMAELNQIGEDPVFDESLKDSLNAFQAAGPDEGWKLINASLNAADKQFDEDIRRRIAEFEPKYDPRTWPLFLQRLADSNFLRAKLIAVKIVEVAAVFLILFTVVNMGRMGKLPFDTPFYNNPAEEQNANTSHDGMAENISQQHANVKSNDLANHSTANGNTINSTNSPISSKSKILTAGSPFMASGNVANRAEQNIFQKSGRQTKSTAVDFVDPLQSFAGINESNRNVNIIPSIEEAGRLAYLQNADKNLNGQELATVESNSGNENVKFLASLISPVLQAGYTMFPKPNYIKQRKSTHTVFGILTQVSYNRLRMPEDRLNSAGRVIVFPQQGLPSYGYGGGFTFALDHPRWAVETGMIYSTKTFEPGRKLAVGTAFDNGIIEFEAMRLQLMTLPFQLRYKVENKGPFKFYAMAGFNLNLIVQSDVDVSIKYHFPSLSAGENPNSNPVFANTIKESRRVSEHIRDGAPFSTKSFVSATAGLGIEYSFNEHKTLFLQSAGQYQIPNLKFSNNNGKHLRTISIQAGVRTPLGM